MSYFGASQVAPVVMNLTANTGDARDTGLIPGLGRAPVVGNVFLPGKFHGQSSLAGYSPKGHTELDTTEHIERALFGRAI